MDFVEHVNRTNVFFFGLSILLAIYGSVRISKSRTIRTTKLRGPPSGGFLFGLAKHIFDAEDPGALFENWQLQYGSAYEIRDILGKKHTVICDPKAIAYFYSKDTFGFRQTIATRFFLEHFFGRNVIWAEAETHRRQRKALASAFSNAAIRNVTPVFYDSAYTLKASWDASFEADASKDAQVIDVQRYMNYISLDSIGTAGFSHDFGALKGQISPIIAVFESFGNIKPSFYMMLSFILMPIFPILKKIPTSRSTATMGIKNSVKQIADDLLDKSRAEQEANQGERINSIIGSLIRSEKEDSNFHMSHEEIIAQMNLLVLAGYETTAVSLTWALIELSRNPKTQDKLRAELNQFTNDDPTWEQLTYGLPYLDAITSETLRLHPAVPETTRQAYEDNIIPLSKPVYDAKGQLIDRIFVAKGSLIRVPIACMNSSEAMWGENAKEFCPDRWLNNSVSKTRASEIQGHRHLLTFVDGPRSCLGKMFAQTEFKAVLSVLIRNYMFELPNGPATKFGRHISLVNRPKVAGQEGPQVPLLVRKVE